jgi:tetratricopeptide (TPR) repeat protein
MQSTNDEEFSPKIRALALALLFAIPFLAYVNTVNNDFVWDDRYVLSENPHVRDLGNIPSFFISSETQASYDMKVYRPLRQAMFAVEYRLFGPGPQGYHLLSIFIHCLNGLLLFLLLGYLGLSVPLSFVASMLFSIHPVHTEVVANITGRTDILFLFFYLIGLICAIRSRTGAQTTLCGTAMIAAYCFSLLSKEMAISFPFMVILVDCYLERGDIRKLKKRLPAYLVLLALSLLYLFVRTKAIGEAGAADYYGDSFWTTMFSETAIIIRYLKLFLVPYPLSARYDLVLLESPFNLFTVVFLVLFTGLVVATVAALSRKTFSLRLLGGWWFVLALLPVSNIIPIRASMMAERYLYLPLIGLLILAVSVFKDREFFRSVLKTRIAFAFFIVIVSVLFTLTVSRNRVWENDLTLFEDTAPKAPGSLAVHWNLFTIYQKAGDPQKAAAEFRAMKRINEETARQYLAIALKYREQGKRTDAMRLAQKALRTKPDLAEAGALLKELEKNDVIH